MKIEDNKPLALGLAFVTVLIAGVVLFAVYTGGSFEMSFSNSVIFGPNTSIKISKTPILRLKKYLRHPP